MDGWMAVDGSSPCSTVKQRCHVALSSLGIDDRGDMSSRGRKLMLTDVTYSIEQLGPICFAPIEDSFTPSFPTSRSI